MSLQAKQVLTGELHDGVGYKDEEDFEARVRSCLDDAIHQGIREITSFIDSSPDIGLVPIRSVAKLREEFKEKIALKIAGYAIFGFHPDVAKPRSRWSVFEEACEIADVVGALPEKDDRKESVGADAHRRFGLMLAISLGKPFHSHEDQANIPTEQGTRALIKAVEGMGSPKVRDANGPTVWAVHAISPSSYPENDFRDIVRGLVSNNIGVICCPSAAISMRQHRDVETPSHNSIARILEMAEAGVEIHIGTDNLSDIFMPRYATMLHEVQMVADILRFYDIPVLAKFAAGVKLNQTNKDAIKRHLEASRG